ncbi:unannotated protein [freshwater metagenome]|uniref:Unannotated protein n=1 Tax=freshwater metagenome TaxID=449393 RepID=A0A6J7KYC3_9ZZZZ
MQRPMDEQPTRAGPSPPKYGSAVSTPGFSRYVPTRALRYVLPTPISSPYSFRSWSAGSSAVTSVTPSIRCAVS